MKKYLFTSLLFLLFNGAKAQTFGGDTTIYIKADTDPSFPGGYEAFQNYINSNKPKTEKINANRFVVARVIVEKDGRFTRPLIKYHFQTTPGLDSAAIQLLKNSPTWKPAMKNGVPVRINFNVQVRFETGYQKVVVAPVLVTPRNDADVIIDAPVISDEPAGDKIFTAVEQQPMYPGGINALYKFFDDNNKLIGKDTENRGRVVIMFIVEKDGSMTDIKVARALGSNLMPKP